MHSDAGVVMYMYFLYLYMYLVLFLVHIDLTSGRPASSNSVHVQYWQKNLRLYTSDKEIITGGKWLNDNNIDAGQVLLKKAYPHVDGLQSTILGETLAFDIPKGEFVQILNVSGCHWITVSNIGCQPGHINIYDSSPNTHVPR